MPFWKYEAECFCDGAGSSHHRNLTRRVNAAFLSGTTRKDAMEREDVRSLRRGKPLEKTRAGSFIRTAIRIELYILVDGAEMEDTTKLSPLKADIIHS